MSNWIISDPIKMRIFGIPTSGSNSSEQLDQWGISVREAAQQEAQKGKTINGECHLYVDFLLPEDAFKQVDIDNLLMPFCGALERGEVIGKKANILGVKAHKNIAHKKEDVGAKVVLIPTNALNIEKVGEISGPSLHERWKKGMQLIKTKQGEFVDNMQGDLLAFRHEGAVPGFNWREVEGREVRGVTIFRHCIERPWINKWSAHLLADHMAEGESADLSGAPKHIKFSIKDKKGPATKSSAHIATWRRNVRSKAKKQVNHEKIIRGDCHLYVDFYIPEVKTKGKEGFIHNFLKVFCDQLKSEKDKLGKIIERGVIKDDVRIVGIKAQMQRSGESVQPGAYAMLMPTKTHLIKNVKEGIAGSIFYPGWKYEMQEITTLDEDGVEGVFMDNMPGYLWGSPYPGFEPGCKWERMEGQKVHGVIVHKKWSETRWINKWDINLLMDGVRKDRQD